MTREEAKKAAEVMMAYADGKEIEMRDRARGPWKQIKAAHFNWELFDYRIKPKPKHRFDPKTLQPFDKVVIWSDGIWCCDFFSSPCGGTYLCVGCLAVKVMPYNDETKHLIGTSDEAPEYYRYWED